MPRPQLFASTPLEHFRQFDGCRSTDLFEHEMGNVHEIAQEQKGKHGDVARQIRRATIVVPTDFCRLVKPKPTAQSAEQHDHNAALL